MYKTSDFEKKIILENIKEVFNFLREFEGDEEDELRFLNLSRTLEENKFAVHPKIHALFDDFIESKLFPMVYDFESVFSFYDMENGGLNSDRWYMEFFKIRSQIEFEWSVYAMKHFHPYLIS